MSDSHDVTRSLAILRNTLYRQCAINGWSATDCDAWRALATVAAEVGATIEPLDEIKKQQALFCVVCAGIIVERGTGDVAVCSLCQHADKRIKLGCKETTICNGILCPRPQCEHKPQIQTVKALRGE